MDYTKAIDYSSLSTYLSCPRKFMFQYVLHLRSVRPSIDLVFGAAWHYGLEQAYRSWKDQADLTLEMLAMISEESFNQYWSIEGEPYFDPDQTFPKSPVNAANMYHSYWRKFYGIQNTKQILSIEEPFTIAIKVGSYDISYIGRMDLIFKNRDFIEITDHKTTKSVNAITGPSFECSMQTDGYLTAGNIYYDSIPRMVYIVALCQKSKHDAFELYEFTKPNYSLERFLSDLRMHCQRIIIDLEQAKNEQSNLSRTFSPQSFLRNPGYACTQYFRKCPYFDICTMVNNPFIWQSKPPEGYIVSEWNPDQHDAEVKAKLLKGKV